MNKEEIQAHYDVVDAIMNTHKKYSQALWIRYPEAEVCNITYMLNNDEFVFADETWTFPNASVVENGYGYLELASYDSFEDYETFQVNHKPILIGEVTEFNTLILDRDLFHYIDLGLFEKNSILHQLFVKEFYQRQIKQIYIDSDQVDDFWNKEISSENFKELISEFSESYNSSVFFM